MPVYNVYWKAIQPNGSSNEGGKTVMTSSPPLAEGMVKAEIQQKWPNATIVIKEVKER